MNMSPIQFRYSPRWTQRYTKLSDVLEEFESGEESDDSAYSSSSRTRENNELMRSSRRSIQDAADLIAGKQIMVLENAPSDSASRKITLVDGDLPEKPSDQDPSPSRLAFRKAGDTFCEEQRVWKGIIESEKHRKTFKELRWTIRLGGWKNDNPQQKLKELIDKLSSELETINSQMADIRSAEDWIGLNIQHSASRIEKLQDDLLRLKRAEVIVAVKRNMVKNADSLLKVGQVELAALEANRESAERWLMLSERVLLRMEEKKGERGNEGDKEDETGTKEDKEGEEETEGGEQEEEGEQETETEDGIVEVIELMTESQVEELTQETIEENLQKQKESIGKLKDSIEKMQERIQKQVIANEELSTSYTKALNDYEDEERKNEKANAKRAKSEADLNRFRQNIVTLNVTKRSLEEFKKELEDNKPELGREIETAKKKQGALEKERIRIRGAMDKEVDRFQWPDISLREQLEAHFEKTELVKYLNTEQENAFATLRDEVKHNPDLNLADNEIDELSRVHCALFMAKPINRSQGAKETIYKKLGVGEFRLLVLKCAPNKYHPLIAHLQKATFREESLGPYAALSYCWGEGEGDHHIHLLPEGKNWIEDSFSHKIRRNLFCALHRLRRRDKDVTLWVDALCIDQENEAEKTHQLGSMVEIYDQARMVCIWLGESDTEGRSDKAMDFIPQLVDMAMLDANTDDKGHADKWAALSELIRDPWFTRRWIVQEVSLAREAVVYCGEKVVHWDVLVDAIALLVANEERVRALFDPSKWRYGRNTLGEIQSSSANILLGVISNLFLTTEDRSRHKPLRSLEYLVTTLQTFDATDPHDLIYALVHISRDHSEQKIILGRQPEKNQQDEPQLYIDYETEVPDLFMHFTKFCVDTSHSLDIICRPWAKQDKRQKTSGEGLTEELPSWIPLLENAEFGGPGQSHKGRKNGRSFVGDVDEPIYNASNDRKAEKFVFKAETMSMQVKGLLLGRLEEVSPRCSGGVVFRESLRLGGWEGIENGSQKVPAQIWRTLIADRTSDGLRPPLWYQRACLRSLEIADMFSGGDLNTGQLSDEVIFVRDYLRRVREVTWNRCFFKAVVWDDIQGLHDSDAASGVKKDVNPPAPLFIRDGLPRIQVEDVDQTLSDANIDTESIASNPEKPVQDEEEVGKTGKEELIETSKELDNPHVPTIHSEPATGEPAANSLTENKERSYSNGQANEPNSEKPPHWFGICPMNTSIKDVVCILFGCSVPVILRPLGNDVYKLVGEAYVHGVMNGEVIKNKDEEQLAGLTKVFTIK